MYVGAPYHGSRTNNTPHGAFYVCPLSSGSNTRCTNVITTGNDSAFFSKLRVFSGSMRNLYFRRGLFAFR